VGPALSGVLQETYKGQVPGIPGFFPTDSAYDLIFIMAALVSLASVAMALLVARSSTGKEAVAVEQRER
jgi:hypothetical protein